MAHPSSSISPRARSDSFYSCSSSSANSILLDFEFDNNDDPLESANFEKFNSYLDNAIQNPNNNNNDNSNTSIYKQINHPYQQSSYLAMNQQNISNEPTLKKKTSIFRKKTSSKPINNNTELNGSKTLKRFGSRFKKLGRKSNNNEPSETPIQEYTNNSNTITQYPDIPTASRSPDNIEFTTTPNKLKNLPEEDIIEDIDEASPFTYQTNNSSSQLSSSEGEYFQLNIANDTSNYAAVNISGVDLAINKQINISSHSLANVINTDEVDDTTFFTNIVPPKPAPLIINNDKLEEYSEIHPNLSPLSPDSILLRNSNTQTLLDSHHLSTSTFKPTLLSPQSESSDFSFKPSPILQTQKLGIFEPIGKEKKKEEEEEEEILTLDKSKDTDLRPTESFSSQMTANIDDSMGQSEEIEEIEEIVVPERKRPYVLKVNPTNLNTQIDTDRHSIINLEKNNHLIIDRNEDIDRRLTMNLDEEVQIIEPSKEDGTLNIDDEGTYEQIRLVLEKIKEIDDKHGSPPPPLKDRRTILPDIKSPVDDYIEIDKLFHDNSVNRSQTQVSRRFKTTSINTKLDLFISNINSQIDLDNIIAKQGEELVRIDVPDSAIIVEDDEDVSFGNIDDDDDDDESEINSLNSKNPYSILENPYSNLKNDINPFVSQEFEKKNNPISNHPQISYISNPFSEKNSSSKINIKSTDTLDHKKEIKTKSDFFGELDISSSDFFSDIVTEATARIDSLDADFLTGNNNSNNNLVNASAGSRDSNHTSGSLDSSLTRSSVNSGTSQDTIDSPQSSVLSPAIPQMIDSEFPNRKSSLLDDSNNGSLLNPFASKSHLILTDTDSVVNDIDEEDDDEETDDTFAVAQKQMIREKRLQKLQEQEKLKQYYENSSRKIETNNNYSNNSYAISSHKGNNYHDSHKTKSSRRHKSSAVHSRKSTSTTKKSHRFPDSHHPPIPDIQDQIAVGESQTMSSAKYQLDSQIDEETADLVLLNKNFFVTNGRRTNDLYNAVKTDKSRKSSRRTLKEDPNAGVSAYQKYINHQKELTNKRESVASTVVRNTVYKEISKTDADVINEGKSIIDIYNKYQKKDPKLFRSTMVTAKDISKVKLDESLFGNERRRSRSTARSSRINSSYSTNTSLSGSPLNNYANSDIIEEPSHEGSSFDTSRLSSGSTTSTLTNGNNSGNSTVSGGENKRIESFVNQGNIASKIELSNSTRDLVERTNKYYSLSSSSSPRNSRPSSRSINSKTSPPFLSKNSPNPSFLSKNSPSSPSLLKIAMTSPPSPQIKNKPASVRYNSNGYYTTPIISKSPQLSPNINPHHSRYTKTMSSYSVVTQPFPIAGEFITSNAPPLPFSSPYLSPSSPKSFTSLDELNESNKRNTLMRMVSVEDLPSGNMGEILNKLGISESTKI